VNKYNV